MDRIIKTCTDNEASLLHELYTKPNSNCIYFIDVEGHNEYHYILVDDNSYRLEYKKLNGELVFTGNAVEIEE
jgi:hypothetical protein